MEFINLKAQYAAYKNEIDEKVLGVFGSGQFVMGKEVEALEAELCSFTGAKHTLSCASGTDALLLALMALDIKAGDEVITTPFTFIATAEVIALVGAKPVFVDIDEQTYNIDPSKIEAAITPKTKAIIPVSLYGQCADMDEINAIAAKHGITVVEDAAQSFGAEYKGKKSCNLSRIGCTSFFPSKPLGCYGDGGAVMTNDYELAKKIASIRVHGQGERYMHKYIGINGRMDAVQCAITRVKLAHFGEELTARARLGARYLKLLADADVVAPFTKEGRTNVYGQFSVRVKNRETVSKKMNELGVPTAVHYPRPLHMQECFAYLGHKVGDFPVSEKVASEIMSLPFSAFLTESEQDAVVDALKKSL
ncbi:MAG: DegT/DnrJ/EryC1/StrS family aminotransferase [Campylobacterales bacterium]|nr:DegT/DnrJ/EryC1/StrS family aminotransferase [Campylobacterales bacterium]